MLAIGRAIVGVLLFSVGACVQEASPAIEHGIVLSTRFVPRPGDNTGVGGTAGMVLGAAAGVAVGGHGAGQVIGGIAGAIVGGATGMAAEGTTQSSVGISYVIRLADGQVVTVEEHLPARAPVHFVDSEVTVITRGRAQHVAGPSGVD